MNENVDERGFAERLFNSFTIYETLFENAPETIIFVSENKILDCNKSALLLFGLSSKKELKGKLISDFLDVDLAENADNLNSAQPKKYNSSILRSDKTRLDVEITKQVLEYESLFLYEVIVRIISHEKKQIELETEPKYKRIFENIEDVYYRTDLSGRIVELSPSIERYAEYFSKDIIGENIENYYNDPEDRNRIIQGIHEKGEILDFEVQLKGKENRLIWASINAHFVYDENKNILGIEGLIRDLTQRKKAEDDIKRSLSLLQATLDSTSDGILVVDLAGNVTNFNKRFNSIFSIDEDKFFTSKESVFLDSVLDKLADPNLFFSKIQYLLANPELESLDTFYLKDNRIIERYSCPQLLDGKPIGRVWSFKDITFRKNAEKQLYLMAHMLNCIDECISITDIENRLLFVNDAFIKTYGYSVDELKGKDIQIICSPKNDPKIIEQIRNLTEGTGWKGEILNVKKDGTEFPVSLSSNIIQNNEGEILGLVEVAIDISDRKEAEKALQESESRFRTFFVGSPDANFLADIETGIIIDANPAASQLLKRSVSEIIGMHQSELHPKDQSQEIKKMFKQHAFIKSTSLATSIKEVKIVTAEGIEIPVEISSNVININGRKVLQGVFRDISERQKAQNQLRESEKKYRDLIETMSDGVYRSTPDGKFLEINPAMVKMLGYESKEELMSVDIKTQLYFNPTDREILVNNHSNEKLNIYPLKRKDGQVVWIEDHDKLIRNAEGRIVLHEGIARDVTERIKSESQLLKYSEELQKLNATKDKFFSIIAHDLKSPFNSISGLSEIIKNDAKELEIATIQQYAGIINSTSDNTYRLLENLLEWAQVQQSGVNFRPDTYMLKKLVNEVIELLVQKSNSKMIALINFIPDKLIITGDRNMLMTILRNLISNALKFTLTNGKVEIKAIRKNKEIEISVKDNGIGITSENIGKLFKIGTNYTQRGTENEKGTGLGLLLCKEFVEIHGGRIWVESEIGKGSDFKFTIPDIT